MLVNETMAPKYLKFFRGGRLTKWKGQVASIAPMAIAAIVFVGTMSGSTIMAFAGSCSEAVPGVWTCSGGVTPGDSQEEPTSAVGGALTVTTETGFGVTTSDDTGLYLVNSNDGTDILFTDNEASVITGDEYGVISWNYGTGDNTVTTTGVVTGQGEQGIYAWNASTANDLTVTAATVFGGEEGIYIFNSGQGATSVTATGTVTGNDGDGVYVYSGEYTSGLTVTSVDVTAGDNGIFTRHYGTGDTTITSTGTIRAGDDGVYAYNDDNAGSVIIEIDGVSGDDYGVYVNNDGTEITRITATGSVVGEGETGIYVDNDVSTTGIEITVVDVTGDTYGIKVGNEGAGDTRIIATGTVTGQNETGIYANQDSTASSTIIEAVDVHGDDHGIDVQNNGIGTVQIATTGTVTSGTNNGINVDAGNLTTGVEVSVAAITGYRNGIDVQNRGAGLTSITATDTVESLNRVGIRAVNHPRGAGVRIRATDVYGQIGGIDANNYGAGALAITTTGTVRTDRFTAIDARNYGITGGGEGAAYGTDLIISTATVSGGSNGISASNEGTGMTRITSSDIVTAGSGNAISARNGEATTELIISTVDVRSESGGDGIFAVHQGTGTTTVTSTGTVESDAGNAFLVRNRSIGGDIVIEAHDARSSDTTIDVRHAGEGAASVTVTGVVNSTERDGISVYNTGYTGGGITILANEVHTQGNEDRDSMLLETAAIVVSNGGGGAVNVTTTGAVTSQYGMGIRAFNSATIGDADLTIETTDVSASTLGILGVVGLEEGYSGDLAITSTGAVTVEDVAGIGALGESIGIAAVHLVDGNIAINAADVSGGGTGILAYHSSGGNIDITTTGAVSGSETGIATTSQAGYLSEITVVSGSSVGATSGNAITNNAGDSIVKVAAGAAIDGSIVLADGSDDIIVSGDFSGITTLDGGDDISMVDGFVDTLTFQDFNDTVNTSALLNWESIVVDNSMLSFNSPGNLVAGDLTVRNNATVFAGPGFTMVGDGLSQPSSNLFTETGGTFVASGIDTRISGNVANNGIFSMRNDAIGDVAIIERDFSGTGELWLDVDTSVVPSINSIFDASDYLVVDGSTSGSTQINVNNIATEASLNDINLAIVRQNSSANDFTLANGSLDVGATAYVLDYKIATFDGTDSGTFFLTPAGKSTPATVYETTSMVLGNFNQMSTLEQRIGQRAGGQAATVSKSATTYDRLMEGYSETPIPWARIYGTKSDIVTSQNNNISSNNWGVQSGIDFDLEKGNHGRWVLGVTGHYASQSSTVAGDLGFGAVSSEGYGLGLTATWYGNGGTYFDAQGQVTWIDSNIASSTSGALVNGLSTKSYALSFEGGHRFENSATSAFIPQAQVSLSHVEAKNFTDIVGNDVTWGGYTNSTARIGLAYEESRGDMTTSSHGTVYVIGNIVHDFSDENTVTLSGTNLTDNSGTTWAEVGFGGAAEWRNGSSAFGEFSYREALDGSGSKSIAGTAGLRFEW